MRERLLELLEKDGRRSAAELAVMLGVGEDVVINEMKTLEEEQIICGYQTLINWDKTQRETVTALIEVKVTPQRGQGFDSIAERIYKFKEVKAVYLMSGGFDFTVIIEGKTMKEVALFVSNKLAPLESVLSTATCFVLKKYKDHGIVLEDQKVDERMIVSP
jgi:DNA-binding Lrp family transcriptional regulator